MAVNIKGSENPSMEESSSLTPGVIYVVGAVHIHPVYDHHRRASPMTTNSRGVRRVLKKTFPPAEARVTKLTSLPSKQMPRW